eukprot:TRINITY_DN6033_c3_g1_i1.p1 TRINITY_DN6033_c3_g1~~TRINITY_DN6033_c3_g1_i1.p1  ORF type:complete len:235 (+),score=96.39 TRINITY_DN6033_c3_g1_i1:69-707(+)
MNIIKINEVKDSLIIETKRFCDERGCFQELFQSEKYSNENNNSLLKQINWQQVSYSESNKNVVRGIHCSPYAKLVSCISGKVLDFVIDLRNNSETYLQSYRVELSSENGYQIFIPPHCGHAFFSCEENTKMVYLQSGVWKAEFEMDVNWRDNQLNLNWPIADNYILSNKDLSAPFLNDAQKFLFERISKLNTQNSNSISNSNSNTNSNTNLN